MRQLFVILFASLLLCLAGLTQTIEIFVAKTGNDKSKGNIHQPLLSLKGAKSRVRQIRASNSTDTVIVWIREGEYPLSQTLQFDSIDGGTNSAPVIFSAFQQEKVSITGGTSIPLQKATQVRDANILRRLPTGAAANMLQVNLSALGIKDFGQMRPRGFGRPYQPAPMELFCNEDGMQLARWPNDTTIAIGKVIDKGSVPRDGDFSNRGGIFEYLSGRPSRWTQANDIWISGFFRYGYADDAVRVARLDTAKHTMATEQPHLYGYESGKTFHRFYAFNLLEEIDEPGEYFIDRKSGMLYFYPPAGSLQHIQVSQLNTPLVMLMNASNIHFRNITFECSRGMGIYIEKGNANLVDQCTFRNLGQVAVMIGKGIAPFKDLKHAGNGIATSGIIGNLYQHLYDNTTFNREGGTNHTIQHCTIYNMGAGGIILGGGNRLTLAKGNNQVINCHIHHFNRLERSYRSAINIDGVGNSIRHCEISNCPGSAILLHGNDHVIEYNDIHHAATAGDDMGAIYYGRNPSEQGNKVRFNFFHHLGNDHGLLVATYHDDGACGMEVTGNVFYKAGQRAVLIGGGHDNVYKNNIFIDTRIGLHIDNRQQNWAKGNIEKGGIFEQRLKAVNYQQPPYSTAYPKLATYFESNPALPQRNFIENNLFVNIGMLHNGKAEWTQFGRNFVTCEDPGFENAESLNFKLKKNAAVFRMLPEFKDIPFEKIGLVK